MLFKDMPIEKKLETYISLISSGLIDRLTNKDTERYGITKDTLVHDVETNFNNLLLTVNNPNNNIVANRLEEKKKLSLIDTNTMPAGFKWTEDNIPTTNPDYYIYDNDSKTRWNNLKSKNAYPKAIGNKKSINKQGEDNFTTYNNVTYRDRFRHEQQVILPISDRTMDAWFDTGIKSIAYYNNVPYSSLYFQKSFYVWYIKGDGTDYPYTGQVRYGYPGQYKNYPYKYENLGEVLISNGTNITIKGQPAFSRFKTKYEGFDLRLDRPNTHTNTLVKVDMGLTEIYGQKYHYQGATLKCLPIFKNIPSTIKLDMRGEDRTLDITKDIETYLTWEFDNFSIVSDNEDIVKVEHDWTGASNDPKTILGPSIIKLIGGSDGIANLTIKAQPKDSAYIETYNIEVTVEQLYKGVTTIEVDPGSWICMVNETLDFTVRTNAHSYNITDPIKKFIRLTPTSITGVKEGSGIVTIKAQAPNSMPAYAKIPYLITKYIPKAEIIKSFESASVNSLAINEYLVKTNIPKDQFKVEIEDNTLAVLDNIVFSDEVEYDKFNSPYVYRNVKISIRGLKEGSTFIKISGYIKDGEEISSWLIPLNIEPEIVKEVIIPQPDDVITTLNSRPDVYLSFHHQHEGIFSYLRSKAHTDPEILENLPRIVEEEHNANKIFVIPNITDEDIAKYKTNEFTLALVEDLNGNSIPGEIGNNPNYLDFKRDVNPYDGFVGNTTKNVGQIYLNYITLERFVSKYNEVNEIYWEGNKGTYIGDKHYPYPGELGFGVGPCPSILCNIYNLTPLDGCEDRNSPNYGNYRTIAGNVFVFIPIMYFRYNVKDNKLINIDVYYPLKDKNNNTVYRDKFNKIHKEDEVVTYNNKKMLFRDTIIKPTAYLDSEYGIFIEKHLITINNRKVETNLPINNKVINWFTVLESINQVNKVEIGTLYDVYEDVMLSTPSIRELLFTIGLASGLNNYTNSSDNNKWLNSLYGMPLCTCDKNYSINNILDNERLNIGNNTINKDIVNYVYNSGYSSHNGQDNGIQDLTNGTLELTIGCMYSLDTTSYRGTYKYNNTIAKLQEEYKDRIKNKLYDKYTVTKTELLGSNNYNYIKTNNVLSKSYQPLLDIRLDSSLTAPQTSMKLRYSIIQPDNNGIRTEIVNNNYTVFNNHELTASSLSNLINMGNNRFTLLTD